MDPSGTFSPVETYDVPEAEARGDGLILVCDHASNAVPPTVNPLGLPEEEMRRHIAWDVGGRGLTLGLAERLRAPAVLSCWSRLVIDPNRCTDDPTLVMKLYDGTVIEGNRSVDEAETQRRIETLYTPYHVTIDRYLDQMIADGRPPAIVSIHSFTPQLKGRPPRPWHVGLLWDRDDRLFRPLYSRLRQERGLDVGDNEPYSGRLAGDCMWMHGTSRGIPHILIEVRNDLIGDGAGEQAWADRLAPVIDAALEDLYSSGYGQTEEAQNV